MAITTTLRNVINRGLGAVGLELSTTRLRRAEECRLRELAESGHWSAPHFARGIEFEDHKYVTFLSEICLPYQDRFKDWPRTLGDSENGFYLQNGWFESVDAEVLYSMIRYSRPVSIVEIGSGFSTRVMHRAISDGRLATKLFSVDPDPRLEIAGYADEYLARKVQELDASWLTDRLHPGDILFIDSSHRITSGGDIPFLFLEVIPEVETGVLIHVHDIFIPFDYPKEWVVEFRWEWNEQYLVHAFLINNDAFEILWPAHYMWRRYRSEVLEVIPPSRTRWGPCSLWLRKLE
jgi:hypothetical protein